MMGARCPVCGGKVDKTVSGRIAGHMDKTRVYPCPASFAPWHTTERQPQ